MKIYWQGLVALVLGILIFLGSPEILHSIDETAGAFDLGYLQRPILALVFFLFATFAAWLAFQLDWPDLDKWIDDEDGEGFADDLQKLSPLSRIVLGVSVFFLLLAAFLVCLALVPV